MVGIGSRYKGREVPKEAMPELWVLDNGLLQFDTQEYTNIDLCYTGSIYNG